MARIIPSDLTVLALQGAHQPEIETLGHLEKALPDAYHVFHGVHWTRQYRGATIYGEIDFVVLTPDGRILCIEQKNGPIEERDGKLIKTYEDGSKDVARQLHRSIESIRGKFEFVNGSAHPLSVEYLIYCPDAALKKVQAAGLDEARIIDASARNDLARRIQDLLPDAQRPRTGFGDLVHGFFRQSFEVVPDIHQHIDVQERNFTRLSGGLVDTLANLEMTPLRLRVHATAGNGKTHVARFFYERMISEGRRPLLMCFNRPLAERLKHLTSSGGVVDTWYGFLDNYLKSVGSPLDFKAMPSNPLFWEKALEHVEETVLSGQVGDDWRFDALIVDEGQDFEARWFETARLFLRDGADILWLEDPNQNLRSAEPIGLQQHGFVGYRSLVNFRTPYSIAQFIQRTLPAFEFISGNDLPGLGVGVTRYDDPEEQPRLVGKLIGRLLTQRFMPEHIAIVSLKGMASTAFKDVERVGNHTIRRFIGSYDLFGNQVMSRGQITFETIRRFKGQQSPVVILVDVEPDPLKLTENLQLLFCGMTRATVRLEVVCNGGNEWVQRALAELD